MSVLASQTPAGTQFKSSDGRLDKLSASGAVESGLIPSRLKSMTLKLILTAFLLYAQH